MSSDLLAKVRQLIGMTGSSNIEEARSMAVQACHLILKHKVVLSLPDGEKEKRQAEFPFSFQSDEPKKRGGKPGARKPRASGWPFQKNEPVKLKSKYKATCKGCGKRVEPGETVHWKRDDGVACNSCGPETFNVVERS